MEKKDALRMYIEKSVIYGEADFPGIGESFNFPASMMFFVMNVNLIEFII